MSLDIQSHHPPIPTDSLHRVRVVGKRRSTSKRSSGWGVVQQLNNRGCVNVTMGNYPEANRLFESALKKHMAYTQAVTSSGCSSDCDEIDTRPIESDASVDTTTTRHINENYCDDDISVDSDDDDCLEEDEEDFFNSCESNTVLDSASSKHDQIPRMTKNSKLRLPSFCGQNSSHPISSPKKFHQVYCLPLVMDELEWKSASLDDKAFVLIFNIAMCNHLWGLQIQHEESKSSAENRGFIVANKLYRLALNHASRVSRTSGSGRASIDYRLCVVAVLNNISHISKTLGGTDSQEALQFDQMLLKAIFWWRDSEEQLRGMNRSNDPNSNSPHNYDNADAQIIDTFLEHVFYLIGASNSFAPAAAA